MAHFRATIQGSRGEASRLGTKNSGIKATINGWNIGVSVYIDHIEGRDCIRIYNTGGSNSPMLDECLLTIWEADEPETVWISKPLEHAGGQS